MTMICFMPKACLNRLMTKPTKWSVRPAKTQISLGIHPVWSESSLCTQLVANDLLLLYMRSEDSNQTGRMPTLIWVFAWRTSFCWFCREVAHFITESDAAYGVHFKPEPDQEKTCLMSYVTTKVQADTKAQISLRIRAVWSAPLSFAA